MNELEPALAGEPAVPVPEAVPSPTRGAAYWLAWPFWNHDERRIRMLWRMMLTMLMVGLTLRLMKIVGISALLGDGPRSPWKEIVGRTVMCLWIVAGTYLFERRTLDHLGLRAGARWLADLVSGSLVGFLAMAGAFGGMVTAGWMLWHLRPDPDEIGLLTAFLLFIVVGFHEEILFRAWMLRNFADGISGRWLDRRQALIVATLASSAFFGWGHLNNPNASIVTSVNIALAGVMLAVPYLVTGRLALSIGLHIFWNYVQGPVLGLPVSGTTTTATLLESTENGPDGWTGGTFGPEGGGVGILAMAFCLVLSVAWAKWREGRVTIHSEVLEPPAHPAAPAPPDIRPA